MAFYTQTGGGGLKSSSLHTNGRGTQEYKFTTYIRSSGGGTYKDCIFNMIIFSVYSIFYDDFFC